MVSLWQILIFSIGLLFFISADINATIVDKNQFPCESCQFWLWPGAKLPQNITIDRLYLLQGFFSSRNHQTIFIDQGQNATRLKYIKELVLVYRLNALQPANNIIAQFEKDAQSWMQNGNNVVGLQLDFDSGTENIKQYNQFLKEIRQSLQKRFQLSITGLMDWTNSPPELNAVDEIVFQTYQGKHNIPQIKRYLTRLVKIQQTIPVNFKLGIIQNATIPENIINGLIDNPKYRGQVIFLLQHH